MDLKKLSFVELMNGHVGYVVMGVAPNLQGLQKEKMRLKTGIADGRPV